MVCTVIFACQGSNRAASQPSHIQMCFMDALTDPPLQLCSPVGTGDESRDGTWESAAKFLLGDRAYPGSQCCGLLPQLSGGRWLPLEKHRAEAVVVSQSQHPPMLLGGLGHPAKRTGQHSSAVEDSRPSTALLHGMGPQRGPSTTCWDSRPTTELLSPRTTQAGPSATGCLKHGTWAAAVCSMYAP